MRLSGGVIYKRETRGQCLCRMDRLDTITKDCQVSQFYEWLAWEPKIKKDFSTMSWEDKRNHLMVNWGCRYEQTANEARQILIETYSEAGKNIRYAECFELSPYGRKISVSEFRNLLNP